MRKVRRKPPFSEISWDLFLHLLKSRGSHEQRSRHSNTLDEQKLDSEPQVNFQIGTTDVMDEVVDDSIDDFINELGILFFYLDAKL